jgi:hypothetical protein
MGNVQSVYRARKKREGFSRKGGEKPTTFLNREQLRIGPLPERSITDAGKFWIHGANVISKGEEDQKKSEDWHTQDDKPVPRGITDSGPPRGGLEGTAAGPVPNLSHPKGERRILINNIFLGEYFRCWIGTLGASQALDAKPLNPQHIYTA